MLYKGFLNPSLVNLLGYAGQALVNSGVKAHNFINRLEEGHKDAFEGVQMSPNPIDDFIDDSKVVLSSLSGLLTGQKGTTLPSGDSTLPVSPSAAGVTRQPVPPSALDYFNAELAQHYGMSRSTAYQEALSNTAYQRAVKDMKAAGLNPAALFGAGKGYTAGGVSYVSDGQSGRSGYGSSGKDEKLFSDGLYHGIATAAGIATMGVMKKGPIGFYIGDTVAKSIMGAMDEIFK